MSCLRHHSPCAPPSFTPVLTLAAALTLALCLSACTEDGEPTLPAGDGAVADTRSDGAPGADAAPAPACSAGANVKPWTLDAAWCVVYRLPVSSAASVSAMAVRGYDYWTFVGGAIPFAGYVYQSKVNPSTGTSPAPSPFFSFAVSDSETYFASEYLAVSPGGYAAVGYASAAGKGQVLWGDAGITTPHAVTSATYNYDAAWLDDTTLLVNGQGVGAAQSGQGVYLVRPGNAPRLLITDLGSYSGPVLVGTSVVLAGGYFSAGTNVYGLSRAELNAAITAGTTLSATADGDLVYSGNLLDAAASGDDLVVARADSAFELQAVSRVPVTVTGDTVSAGTAADIATPGASKLDRVRLADGAAGQVGLLWESGGATALALIKQK